VPGSIVNPAKLQQAARDSICEQCHLAGEVRIPNPGKSMADFQPGQRVCRPKDQNLFKAAQCFRRLFCAKQDDPQAGQHRRIVRVVLLHGSRHAAPYEVNAALALLAAGRKAEAVRHLERAVELDPLVQQAVELLSGLYRDQGNGAKAASLIARYRHEMGITSGR